MRENRRFSLSLDSHRSELAKGAIAGFGSRLASLAVVFAFNVALTRTLGAEQAGLFYLSIAVVSLLVVLSLLGIDNGGVRHSANLFAESRWGDLAYMYRRSIGVVAAAAGLLAAALFFSADIVSLEIFSNRDLIRPLATISLALPFLALTILTSRFLQAAKRPAVALFFQNAAVQAVLIALLLLLPLTWDLDDVTRTYPLAAFLAFATCAFLWFKRLPRGSTERSDFDFGNVMQSGRALLPANIVNKIIRPWTAVLCLGVWATSTDVAWFSAATRVAALISFSVLPVNTILAPKVAVLAAQGEQAMMFRLAIRATLIIVLFAIPCIAPVLLVPGFVMGIFGPDFAAGAGILVVLSLGQLINVLTGPVQSLLVMTGNEPMHRRASYIGGIASVALCIALIPKWGGLGAAWATTGAVAVTNLASLAMVWLLWRRSLAKV